MFGQIFFYFLESANPNNRLLILTVETSFFLLVFVLCCTVFFCTFFRSFCSFPRRVCVCVCVCVFLFSFLFFLYSSCVRKHLFDPESDFLNQGQRQIKEIQTKNDENR